MRPVWRRPLHFGWQVLNDFRANRGFLLAGAVAYYTLLSVVPLFILGLLIVSQVADRTLVIATLGRYLTLVVPGATEMILGHVEAFVERRNVYGPVMVGTLVFFSSMAFSTLTDAISMIFHHRAARGRNVVVAALLPYLYVLLLLLGLTATTSLASVLQAASEEPIRLMGRELALDRVSLAGLRLLGFLGEVLLLSSVYLAMPVGRVPLRHALLGGLSAAVLWELARRLVVWYLGNLSPVDIVYGSLTAPIVALLTLEAGAIIVLLGAQVIATYEKRGPQDR